MENKIKISCSGAATLLYSDLEPFQGELKSLSTENFQKLRKEILELGFSEPVSVWRSEGKNFILNGHQRVRTVKQMIEQDGFICDPLPVSWIEADSYHQAKRKVLALTSQYGQVERQGLYEFMTEAQISPGEFAESFRLPELDIPSFNAEFFMDDVTGSDGKQKEGAKELSEDGFSQFDHKCPRCGFEFDE